MRLVGNQYWVHGPLVFAPATLAERVAREFANANPVFKALRQQEATELVGPQIASLFGTKSLLLPGGTPTGWVPMDGGGVLLRPHKKLRQRKPESFVVSEKLADVLEVGSDWVLFDSASEAQDGSAEAQARTNALPVPLAPGRYVVEYSTPAPLYMLEYSAVRLLLEGAAAPVAVKPRTKSGFAVDAAMKKQAKALRFLESEGGPFVALPVVSLPQWRGIEPSERKGGESDYDRVCNARGNVLGKSEGLILPAPDSTAVLATESGVVFVHWVGADSAVDLLAALPHAKRWKRSKTPFETEGPLALIDSGDAGRRLGKSRQLEVPLTKGVYDIDTIEVQGKVEGGGEVMAGFTRLTRR